MARPTTIGRSALAATFTALLLGSAITGAGTALADDIPVNGDGAIPLTLEVEDTGELYMSVDNTTPVALTENGSDDQTRNFTGTLPTVTVTDTRSTIPADVAWSVVGQSSDFVHADDPDVTIPGEYLGWAPALLEEPTDNDSVSAGFPVESVAEGGDGLATGTDLLIWSYNSGESEETSNEWKANAELELITSADEVEAGSYTATLTLSLFEY